MVAQFVDVSAFQGNIDWTAYKQWASQWDGVSRVAMKATEGVGFTDPQFAANRAGALAAGIDVIIYYHFARPDLGNGPIVEANWQRQVVGDIRSSDMIMLDYEVASGRAEWPYVWLAQQENNYGGKLPGIYASSYYVETRLQDSRLVQFPLWLANWQYTPDERPPVPSPWSSYVAVQYTDKATNIPGLAGVVDANIFLGVTMNNTTYGPGKGDFDSYFVANDDNHWTCKQTGAVIQFGNLELYRQLSIDGLTLPVIGLPLQSEQYEGQASTQHCERASIRYNPDPNDRQPGLGASHLAFVDYSAADKLQAALAQIQTLQSDVANLQAELSVNLEAKVQAFKDALNALLSV